MNKTIIYITSNYESDAILNMTKRIALDTGLPIISVSQKPMDFGENICVGDVGRSGFNAHRQVLLGCKRAKTDYVIRYESDTLYPPQHIAFVPPENNRLYVNKNTWRYAIYRQKYVKKRKPSVGLIIAHKKYLIDSIEKMLDGLPEWSDEKNRGKYHLKVNIKKCNWTPFETKQPVVSIYHKDGMHRKLTNTVGYWREKVEYWPSAKELACYLA